ncbi:CTP-dependent riboflavin kinase [Natronobacterium texcoconense]|uniref:Riboflavin kinase n=2 Tax=Natronobacterium texcoconense TaxID=1095778 RepID=A0A1H1GF31_NATTX|nr:CTP-dependent riboflavin kinase [Natronobacterium texcoconense]
MLLRADGESEDMSLSTESAVGPDELAVLKLLALEGGLEGDVKISCSHLADRLDASNQTASRRLQRLEGAELLERDTVSDGQWVAITDDGERALHAEYEDYRRIFKTDSEVELEGTVTSGMGEGRHYISLPGYKRQFEDRLGYEPFPGTLNLDLREDSVRRRSAIGSLEPVPIDGWEDDERTYGPAVCYPATIETSDGETYENAHTIAPERTHHDDDQLEIIAPEKLREELGLEDGDFVTVAVGDRQ